MNSLQDIRLDESTHIYYNAGGFEVPGVTRVLDRFSSIAYAGITADVLMNAARIGTAVHRLIELDAHDELDEASIDERLQIYFAQWRQFRACSGFICTLSEQRLYSRRYGFAGTLDLFGWLNDELALIDAKRTAIVPATAGLQLAGYEIALRESCQEIVRPADRIRRYALHLAPQGWRLVPFRSNNDERVFLAALTCHKFEQELKK